MSAAPDDDVDAFLEDVAVAARGALVEAFAQPPQPPSAELRRKILASASHEGRFARFAGAAASILDIDEAAAGALLDRLHLEESWHSGLLPQVHLYDVEGGPRVAGAITGFVRMPAGASFPPHEHAGAETTLIIQGTAIDSTGAIWRPGDVVVQEAGSAHAFEVRPGPDLVFLVVVQKGLKIGDREFGPGDPNL